MLVRRSLVSCAALVALLSSIAAGQSRPVVRVADGAIRPAGSAETAPTTVAPGASAPVGVCGSPGVAHYGQAVPGGGTLASIAHANAATRSGVGGSAFFSAIAGSPRNQGIFVADAQGGLQPIVVGCGGGGGSGVPGGGVGDPSPIGGTFSGLFGGTFFAPASNLHGDVLFLADVDGGSSPRGLFLYRDSTQAIEKVAAIGDAIPGGGTIAAVGPGSLNDEATVVFAVRGATASIDRILKWGGAGVTTQVAATGDPAPLGGTFAILVSESVGFADGTSIPVGPLPDVNNNGSICFRAITDQGTRGIIVTQVASPQWWVRAGDATPLGGTYFDFQGAVLNDAGQIAFFADWQPTPSTFSSGWFVGEAFVSWRAALSFNAPVAGGQCVGLAYSRNPMQPLDEDGNLAQWIVIDHGGGVQKEAQVISAADGSITVVAQQGDPTPLGGSYSTFDAWPSLEALRGTFGAATPGGAGLNAYVQFELCTPPPTTYCTPKMNSQGCVPVIAAGGAASASATSGFTVHASNVLNQTIGLLIYNTFGAGATPFGGGLLCLGGVVLRTPGQSSGGSSLPTIDCSGTYAFDMNAFAAGALGGNPDGLLKVPGTEVFTQYWSRDTGFAPPQNVGLTGGLQYTVGI